jgi:hypothetical protein
MPKAEQGNPSGPAAPRSGRGPGQWQQQSQGVQAQMPRSSTRKGTLSRRSWLLIEGILVVVVVVVAIFVYLANPSARGPSSSGTVLKAITHVDPSVLARVGTGSASNVMKPVAGAPPLTGPTGKPEFFYVGADYCPFCAGQRWAIIVALSRFGTFSNVGQITSSEGGIPTFTFYRSTYKSQYIDFVPVEVSDNQRNTLQQPTPDQQRLLTTYDAPPYTAAQNKGAIPFIDIANRLVAVGSSYSPEVLLGSSWDAIANQFKDPGTDISKGVLGAANYLTAALCLATRNQPASVCATGPLPQIEELLPQAFNTGKDLVEIAANPSEMGGRRWTLGSSLVKKR